MPDIIGSCLDDDDDAAGCSGVDAGSPISELCCLMLVARFIGEVAVRFIGEVEEDDNDADGNNGKIDLLLSALLN